MSSLTTRDQAALSAIANAISDPKTVLTAWQDGDLFQEVDNTGVHLRVGMKATQRIDMVAQRHARSSGRSFPALLAALLATFDGMNIEETPSGEIEINRESSVRDVWNGWLAAEDIESDEIENGEISGLRFAMAFAQCRLLLVDEGKRNGAIVFDDAKGDPIVVATNLADFLLELSESGLSIEAVVGKRMG